MAPLSLHLSVFAGEAGVPFVRLCTHWICISFNADLLASKDLKGNLAKAE